MGAKYGGERRVTGEKLRVLCFFFFWWQKSNNWFIRRGLWSPMMGLGELEDGPVRDRKRPHPCINFESMTVCSLLLKTSIRTRFEYSLLHQLSSIHAPLISTPRKTTTKGCRASFRCTHFRTFLGLTSISSTRMDYQQGISKT